MKFPLTEQMSFSFKFVCSSFSYKNTFGHEHTIFERLVVLLHKHLDLLLHPLHGRPSNKPSLHADANNVEEKECETFLWNPKDNNIEGLFSCLFGDKSNYLII